MTALLGAVQGISRWQAGVLDIEVGVLAVCAVLRLFFSRR